MKYAIYQPVYTKTADDRWAVRMEVIGTADNCNGPEHAIQLARAAGFFAPVVGEWKEQEQ